jgi:hypothetical protein
MKAVKTAAGLDCPDGSLKELNLCFQRCFINQGERFEQSNKGSVNVTLVNLYKSYNRLIEPLSPPQNEYDIVVVLGSTFPNMQVRTKTLLGFYEKGLRFKKLVFLGSDRPMDPKVESAEVLKSYNNKNLMAKEAGDGPLPQTETQAAQFIVDRVEWPAGFPPIIVLDTLCPAGKKRATTEDTIQTLVAHQDLMKDVKSILFMSSQPFALKQGEDIRAVLGGVVPFDMAADDVLIQQYDPNSPFALKNLNDNTAKQLYQTLQNHKNGKSTSCPVLIKERTDHEL